MGSLVVNRLKDRTKMLGREPLVADYPKVWPFPTKSLATSVQPIFHQILTVFLDAHPGSC